eukprot:354266-Chlamydomonas_euryale.AAC.23
MESLGGSWEPELDAPMRACLAQLPWWQGYTEVAAIDAMLGPGTRRWQQPKPLPRMTDKYFKQVAKPQLHICPLTIQDAETVAANRSIGVSDALTDV